MIDVTSEQAPARLLPAWVQIWERIAASGVQCGLQAILKKGKKYYRAYAYVMLGDEEKRVQSDEYEACDNADPDESRMHRGSLIPEHVGAREMAIQEAAQARQFMTAAMRSPKDMQAIAYDLAQQLWVEAQEYDRVQAIKEQQRLYDVEAVKHFDLWYRGGEVRHGEAAMKRLFSGGKTSKE